MRLPSLHFDRRDYEFLNLINRTIAQDGEDRVPFSAALHPNGIIGLAVPRELRMAAAAVTAEIRISRFARFIDALAFLNGRI